MKNNTLNFLFLFLVFFCSQTVHADCIIQHNNINTGNQIFPPNSWGQTFIPCESGVITEITFELLFNGNAPVTTHELRIATSPVVPTAALGSPVLETFSTAGTSGAETITIPLSTPFAVTAGQTYAFEIRLAGSLSLASCTTCTYPDGNRYTTSTNNTSLTNEPAIDFNFSVTIVEADSVPTLSEWGLIVLALLLMTLGTVYLLKPNLRQE